MKRVFKCRMVLCAQMVLYVYTAIYFNCPKRIRDICKTWNLEWHRNIYGKGSVRPAVNESLNCIGARCHIINYSISWPIVCYFWFYCFLNYFVLLFN